MSIDKVPMVLIDLTQEIPTGASQMIIRCAGDEVELVNLAASILGMRQADFLRRVAIGGAKKVIEESAR